MARYTVKYNRTSYHIAGIDTRTAGTELNYPLSACPALSRSESRMAIGASTDDLSEALRKATAAAHNRGAKLCAKCSEAAEVILTH